MWRIRNFFIHYFGTTKHKFWVAWYLFKFSMNLFWRAVFHDISKYYPSEAKGFIKTIHKLKNSTYGSDEYRRLLRQIKPNIDLHYKRHSHHPEHYGDEGIDGMSLVDIVEMWCDWQAAVRRHKDGDIEKSIETNRKRFEINNQLVNILYNEKER